MKKEWKSDSHDACVFTWLCWPRQVVDPSVHSPVINREVTRGAVIFEPQNSSACTFARVRHMQRRHSTYFSRPSFADLQSTQYNACSMTCPLSRKYLGDLFYSRASSRCMNARNFGIFRILPGGHPSCMSFHELAGAEAA